MAQNIYDNNSFFNEYNDMRIKGINANELIEIPIFKSMLPSLKGKKVLDLGCGFGGMSKLYAEMGASRVLALDISENMIDLAKQQSANEIVEYKVSKMEDIDVIKEKFDLIASSLAFHYIENFDKLICDIKNLLLPNGQLLFSCEHPLTTCLITPKSDRHKKHVDIEGKRYYLISDYNNNGQRSIDWNNTDVIKYHRNFSEIVNTLSKHNFFIDSMQESWADEKAISLVDKYKYQKDRPYFLFILAHKLS